MILTVRSLLLIYVARKSLLKRKRNSSTSWSQDNYNSLTVQQQREIKRNITPEALPELYKQMKMACDRDLQRHFNFTQVIGSRVLFCMNDRNCRYLREVPSRYYDIATSISSPELRIFLEEYSSAQYDASHNFLLPNEVAQRKKTSDKCASVLEWINEISEMEWSMWSLWWSHDQRTLLSRYSLIKMYYWNAQILP